MASLADAADKGELQEKCTSNKLMQALPYSNPGLLAMNHDDHIPSSGCKS